MNIKKVLGFKNIAILGFGKEGKAVFDFLRNINFSGKIKVLDQKYDEKIFDDLSSFDLIIKSPGISRYKNKGIQIEFEKGKLTSGTEIFLSNCKGRTIGITGTKGKSTTSSLLYLMLKNKFGDKVKLIGNIGNPAISFLNNDTEENIYIIELSSYQIEDLGKGVLELENKFDINSSANFILDYGIIVSIFPDHLDYHLGFENYKNAKLNIYNISKNVLSFEENNDFRYLLEDFDFSKLKLKGQHNINNSLLAIEVAKKFGVNNEDIQRAIEDFVPLNHRLSEFNFLDRIWINDAISTTPESTLAGIEVYKENLNGIILGGLDRGYDFDLLITYLSKLKKLKAIALLPDNDEKILNLIKSKFSFLPKIIQSKNMLAIVEFLYNNSSKGGVIMLSTASPSYNLYKNFEEQGSDFINNIKLLNN